MKRIFMTFLWWGLTAAVLEAQSIPHRAVKCDVSALGQNRLQIAFELFHHRSNGFEFQVAFEQNKAAQAIPTSGLIQFNRYGQERLDTFFKGTKNLAGTSGWVIFDENKPLAETPINMHRSSWEFSAFYRNSFQKAGSPWIFAIKPGVFASFHQYFSSIRKNYRFLHAENSFFMETSAFRYEVRHTSELWQQEWQTQLKRHKLVGVAFQCSVSRQFGKFLMVEAGLEGRVAFGSALYEDPAPPKIMRAASWKPVLNLGYTF